MGKIFLNQLKICTIIGTLPQERVTPQTIFVDVEVDVPMKTAGISDDLNDALDYSALEEEIVQLTKNSSFQLLEALLCCIGTAVTAHAAVRRCRVRIEKPQAAKYGKSIAVAAEFTPEGMVE